MVFFGGGGIPQNLKNSINHVPNFFGGLRLCGNSQYTTGSSGQKTSYFKHEAEAPFAAVRIWIGEKNSSGTPGVFSAVVGPTETMDYSTVNNAYVPIQGGTAYNSLASANGGPGFQQVTWNGSTTVTMPLAPASSNSASYIVSDWIPCPSIPRTDVAGGRPAITWRVAQTVNGANIYTQLNGNFSGYYAARDLSLPWYREVLNQSTASVDGVTTLTNLPASVSATGGFTQYAWLEFAYNVPTRNIVVIGDSRSECSNAQYNYNPWPLVGLLPLSTQAAPIAYTNLAGSGHSDAQFLALLDGVLTPATGSSTGAGLAPTDIIFQGWCQNGFTQNTYGASVLQNRHVQYMQKLQAKGTRIWMTTDYGLNGYTGAAEAGRLQCVNWVKALGTSGLVTVIDTDANITDYSGGAGIIKAAYDTGDHVHANPAGQAVISTSLQSVWLANQ